MENEQAINILKELYYRVTDEKTKTAILKSMEALSNINYIEYVLSRKLDMLQEYDEEDYFDDDFCL